MLYFAYGMNTSTYEMAFRCPGASSLGRAHLLNASFRFADHADIIECEDSAVDGVLWSISDEDLKSLDRLEGYPYYYSRKSFEVEYDGKIVEAIAYYMQPGKEKYPPSQHYLDMLIEGYTEHEVPIDQLENALEMSFSY